MFLRLTRNSTDPAKYEQVMRFSQDVVDAVKKLPGFQHAYQSGDASSGRGVLITVWDTKEHAQFDRSALGDVISRVQSLGTQMEAPEFYEIHAQS